MDHKGPWLFSLPTWKRVSTGLTFLAIVLIALTFLVWISARTSRQPPRTGGRWPRQ